MQSIRALLSIWLAAFVLIVGISSSSFASPKTGKEVGAANAEIKNIENLQRFGGVLGSNWALADFDGDHQPDFARSRRLGHNKNGYLYRVDLKLSLDQTVRSFTFTDSDAMSLKIDAIDVDGDNDLDLVISDLPFGHKVGIWINNGHGTFERQAVDLYPAAFTAASVNGFHWNGFGLEALDNSFRQLLTSLSCAAFTPVLSSAIMQVPPQSDRSFRFSSSSTRFRAPPLHA